MMLILISLTALFGVAAAAFAWAGTRIKPELQLVMKGLPIYADNQTGPILNANEHTGRLNRFAAACTLAAVLCGFAAGWMSFH